MTTAEQREALLPCPCGNPAQMHLIHAPMPGGLPLYGGTCSTPACWNGPWRNTEAEAIAAWNRRAPADPTSLLAVIEGRNQHIDKLEAEVESLRAAPPAGDERAFDKWWVENLPAAGYATTVPYERAKAAWQAALAQTRAP